MDLGPIKSASGIELKEQFCLLHLERASEMTPIRFVILLTCSVFEVFGGAGFEIAVTDRAMVQRCVTSNDARNIAVGMPGGFNYTFDPVRCRLDAVWFGAFLDYRNEATGRGGGKVQILGAKQSVGSEEVPSRG